MLMPLPSDYRRHADACPLRRLADFYDAIFIDALFSPQMPLFAADAAAPLPPPPFRFRAMPMRFDAIDAAFHADYFRCFYILRAPLRCDIRGSLFAAADDADDAYDAAAAMRASRRHAPISHDVYYHMLRLPFDALIFLPPALDMPRYIARRCCRAPPSRAMPMLLLLLMLHTPLFISLFRCR